MGAPLTYRPPGNFFERKIKWYERKKNKELKSFADVKKEKEKEKNGE